MLAQGAGIAPIPGTKRVRWLEENAQAADITLTAADIAFLDTLLTTENVAGERYPPSLMQSVDRD